MPVNSLQDQLVRDECNRLKPYMDCCGKPWRECSCKVKGKLSIGIGRNLDDVGISTGESLELNDNDIEVARRELYKHLPWTATMDEIRRGVLVNMAFNMGIEGLLEFHHMIEHMRTGDYQGAAAEMLASKWADEVGDRSKRLAKQLITGVWQ